MITSRRSVFSISRGRDKPASTDKSDKSQQRPPYLVAITVLTGIYLSFELGFNARLLDVAGGLATPDEVSSIEHWGRYISGIALALAVWGLIMPRATHNRWRFGRWVIVLAVSAAVSISFAYNGEKALIDSLVDKSDGSQRQIAAELTLFSHAILEHDLGVDGIALSPNELAKPEGKSFIALFPVLAFSTNDLNSKAAAALRQVIARNIGKAIGTPREFYNKTYIPSVQKLRDIFNDQYRTGANKLHDALNGIPATQTRAWDDYVGELGRNRLNPGNVPQRFYGQVRDKVRQQGVPVPDNWWPGDRATFNAAIRDKIEREARQNYHGAIEQKFGVGADLPDDLQWEAFIAYPLIQKSWKDDLNRQLNSLSQGSEQPWKLPDDTQLTSNMNLDAYSKAVYDPLVDHMVDGVIDRYQAPVSSFENRGQNETFGKNAMEALLVPPIALGFSLFGALVHITKFSTYSLRFSPRLRRIKFLMAIVGGIVACFAVAAYYSPNEVTSSRAYDYLRVETKTHLGDMAQHAFTWVIQAQPYAYPFNEFVREVILAGMTFGYNPGSERQTPGKTQIQAPPPPSPPTAQQGQPVVAGCSQNGIPMNSCKSSATGGKLQLISGNGDFVGISATNKTLNVLPGTVLSGTIMLRALNLGPPSAVAPLIYTPSWGDPANSWRLIQNWIRSGQSDQNIQIKLQVPNVPGTYHIVFAFQWEIGGDHVASATNWDTGMDRWNNGNGIAALSDGQLVEAQAKGYTSVNWLYKDGYKHQYVPVDAITLVVQNQNSPLGRLATTNKFSSRWLRARDLNLPSPIIPAQLLVKPIIRSQACPASATICGSW